MVSPTEDAALDAPAAVEIAGARAFDNSQAALPGSSLRPVLVAREMRLAVLAMNPPVLMSPANGPRVPPRLPSDQGLIRDKKQNLPPRPGFRRLAAPVPYRPVPGIAIYHVSVDHYAVMLAEHDLAGPPPCWPLGIRWLHLMRTLPCRSASDRAAAEPDGEAVVAVDEGNVDVELVDEP
jgi:hypothetical protein